MDSSWLLGGIILAANLAGQTQATIQHARGRCDREWPGLLLSFGSCTVWLLITVYARVPLWQQVAMGVLWLLVLRDLNHWWQNRRRRLAAKLAGYKARAVLARMRARAAAA